MSGVATAIVGSSIISGVMGGRAQRKSAQSASSAQVAATEMSIEEQRRQFDEAKKLLEPYVAVGEPALAELAGYADFGPQAIQQQAALAGLQGPQAQQAAITAIEQSPLFQAQVRQGEEALLQQASATGGLRGGNIQGALAQFRPQMLQQQIEQEYARLGGLSQFGAGITQNLASIGQASAAGQAAQGLQIGSNIGNLLSQAGQAQAQAKLAAGAANAQAYSGIASGISQYATLNALGAFKNGGMFAPATPAPTV